MVLGHDRRRRGQQDATLSRRCVVFPRNMLSALGKPGLSNLKKGILMTDLKRRSLVAALGAAPFAVPLLAHAQALDANPKFKQISSRERIRQRYFPNLVLTAHEGQQVEVLRRPCQRQDRDLQHVLCEVRGYLHADHQKPGEIAKSSRRSRWQRHLHVLVYAQAKRGHGQRL